MSTSKKCVFGFLCVLTWLLLSFDLLLWAVSHRQPVQARLFFGSDVTFYVGSHNGIFVAGRIKGFSHGDGQFPELNNWLNAIDNFSLIDLSSDEKRQLKAGPGVAGITHQLSLADYVAIGEGTNPIFGHIPITVQVLEVRHWIATLLLGVSAIFFSRKTFHGWNNIGLDNCKSCEYSIVGIRSGICPECGKQIQEKVSG